MILAEILGNPGVTLAVEAVFIGVFGYLWWESRKEAKNASE